MVILSIYLIADKKLKLNIFEVYIVSDKKLKNFEYK